MSMQGFWLRMRLAAVRCLEDARGIAATEFAMILPIMAVMFFGAVEVSSGVAVDRKVTLDARTLADVTSQAAPDPAVTNAQYAPVDDTYLKNVFTSAIPILKPYDVTAAKLQISEIYVDNNQVAKIQWSRAGFIASNGDTQATLTTSTRTAGDIVTAIVPAALLVKKTYLLFSEVSYNYKPMGIGYVLKNNLTLSDVAYSRPRQALCVVYTVPNPPQPNVAANNNLCPQT
nr:TadE/TadG family type IV pilus assembly protein [Bradyrhizobium lablabi]